MHSQFTICIKLPFEITNSCVSVGLIFLKINHYEHTTNLKGLIVKNFNSYYSRHCSSGTFECLLYVWLGWDSKRSFLKRTKFSVYTESDSTFFGYWSLKVTKINLRDLKTTLYNFLRYLNCVRESCIRSQKNLKPEWYI